MIVKINGENMKNYSELKKLIKKELSYSEYMNITEDLINNTDTSKLNKEDLEIFDYTELNLQRSNRIEKTFVPSKELEELITNFNDKQTWMVITENWCGDSAQNLPYIAKLAELNENIDLVIVLRDSNPEIMDKYLTNGTKSIPILIVFDENGNELFKWGPRPEKLKKEILEMKSKGIVKPELYEKLHLWYGRNKGIELSKELTELFSKVVNSEITN